MTPGPQNILTITRAFDEVKEDPAYAARPPITTATSTSITAELEYRSDEVTRWYGLSTYTRQNSQTEMVSRTI
jgi:hypothetical protein